MTCNLAIKMNDGEAYVFGNVETFRLTPHSLKLLPRGTLSQWTLINLEHVKEITIKPMPEIHSQILAWEQSVRDNLPRRIA